MKTKCNLLMGAGALATLFAYGAGTLLAQSGHGGQQASQDQSQQKPTLQKDKQPVGALTLEGQPLAPVAPATNPEEEAAFKAFSDVPTATPADLAKKLQLGEGFIAKYPQSRYLSNVYSNMVYGYFVTSQTQKMTDLGEKEIALNPNDVNVLAMVSQVMVRSLDAKSPTAAQTLAKAEQYSKHAIEVVTTMGKPEGTTDEAFGAAKSQVLSMAHSSLGVAYVRRGKFTDAIPELDQSVKLVSQPDPVNFYLLGLANEKASHFDDAVTAFAKCAQIDGPMQNTCKQGAEEAKKLATTQLSTPK